MSSEVALILLAWLLAINVATAAAYAWDKRAATRGGRRIRERTLWALCFAGGVGGAWLVFLRMRHKTRHRTFWAVQVAATAAWVGILVWVLAGGAMWGPA